jgi:hypothetical protein
MIAMSQAKDEEEGIKYHEAGKQHECSDEESFQRLKDRFHKDAEHIKELYPQYNNHRLANAVHDRIKQQLDNKTSGKLPTEEQWR